jgi:hypothetical protein
MIKLYRKLKITPDHPIQDSHLSSPDKKIVLIHQLPLIYDQKIDKIKARKGYK